jgi:hypothetical protein
MKSESDQERYRLALEPLTLPRFASRDASRPFVVALEGANGAGKTRLPASVLMRPGSRIRSKRE